MWLPWKMLALMLLSYVSVAAGQKLSSFQFRMYCNSTLKYGVTSSMLITIKTRPDFPFKVRVTTTGYLVTYFLVNGPGKMEPDFRPTDSVVTELLERKIYPRIKITYNEGVFVAVDLTMWTSYNGYFRLDILPLQERIRPLTQYTLYRIKSPEQCMPALKGFGCSDPNTPISVVAVRSRIIWAYFVKTCGAKSGNLSWKLFDIGETRLLNETTADMQHVVKRYSLSKYPTVNELWRNLFVFLIEGKHKSGHVYIARCYIKAIQMPIEATINGGKIRFATQRLSLLLDGSRSRDYSKRLEQRQFKKYDWVCTSIEDSNNRACNTDLTNASSFTIPPSTLHIGATYKFQLTVVRDDDSSVKHVFTQAVTVIREDYLHVSILCTRNCVRNLFNPFMRVILAAKCYNCGRENVSYEWYVFGQLQAETKTVSMVIATTSTIVSMDMVIRTPSGRSGRHKVTLIKNVPPISGSCYISPPNGLEAITYFQICCNNYHSDYKPIEYFYYANRVLLGRCSNCECGFYLPADISVVRILVCDVIMTCRQNSVRVNIMRLPTKKIIDKPDVLFQILTGPPYDLLIVKANSDFNQFYQIIQSFSTRIDNVDCARVLLNAHKDVNETSLVSLGKLANLTITFATQMSPIDDEKQMILSATLNKLNNIFNNTYDYELHTQLIIQPFINVTRACISVYSFMDNLNKYLPRPPQLIFDKYYKALRTNKLDQSFIDRLVKIISQYNEEAMMRRSFTWLNSTWETERLFRLLNFTRMLELQPDLYNIESAGVSLEKQCFYVESDREHKIDTRDGMHTVFFPADLLDELKDQKTNYICLKVVSTIRQLNWWYPEEKQPSAVLLSVRIYHTKDDFKHEILLAKSHIHFMTIIGIYKPALIDTSQSDDLTKKVFSSRNLLGARPREDRLADQLHHVHEEEEEDAVADTGRYINCLEEGKLDYMQQVAMYRINLDKNSMVAVTFKTSTHALHVLLFCGNPPKLMRSSVSKSKCRVPASNNKTVMLLRNKCTKEESANMLVQVLHGADYHHMEKTAIPNGPALFSFVFQVRTCDYWMYKDLKWDSGYCRPVLAYQKKGTMHCNCTVLGTYTSYVYHVPVIVVPVNDFVAPKTNWGLVAAYVVIPIFLFIWLTVLFIWYNKLPIKTVVCDMSNVESDTHRDLHDILIVVKTGGRINSQTTATVRIIVQTIQRTELQFTLMQDPERPELARNSNYVLWVRSRDIRIPTRVAVAHNNAGRYPSWYLRNIEILDVQAQLSQIFMVHRWVRHKFLVLSSSTVLRPGEERIVVRWRKRFGLELERQWINWGLWQPLWGTWRATQCRNCLTRCQRVCVFVCKLMATYCVVACYMGPSTHETINAAEMTILNPTEFLSMLLIACVVTNLIQFTFEFCILKEIDD